MNGNYLKIIFVIDESGSMQGCESDVIGGFNNFIESQRNETVGKVSVSLYKFNSLVSKTIVNKPLSKIYPLNREHYNPNGFTALYDAIGKAIEETGNQISIMHETDRPDKVLMVIFTDGKENASKEFSAHSIKTLIATHENMLHWRFIYLGAGLTDFSDANSIGIKDKVELEEIPAWKRVFRKVSDSCLQYRQPDSNDDAIVNDLLSELKKNED